MTEFFKTQKKIIVKSIADLQKIPKFALPKNEMI